MKRNAQALRDWCDFVGEDADVPPRKKRKLILHDNWEILSDCDRDWENITSVISNTPTNFDNGQFLKYSSKNGSFNWYAVYFQTPVSIDTKKDNIVVNLTKQGSKLVVFGFVRQYTQSSSMDISYVVLQYYYKLFEFKASYPHVHVNNQHGKLQTGFIDVDGIDLETDKKYWILPRSNEFSKVTMSLKLMSKVCLHRTTDYGGYEIRVGLIGFRKNQLKIDNNNKIKMNTADTNCNNDIYLTKKDFFDVVRNHQPIPSFGVFGQKCMSNKGFKDFMIHGMIFRKYCSNSMACVENTLILRGDKNKCESSKQIRLNWGETTVVTTVDLIDKTLEYSVLSSNPYDKEKEIVECDLLGDEMIYIFTFLVDGCDCHDLDLDSKGMTYQLDINYEKN